MNEITRTNLILLRADLDAAMAQVAAKHNLSITLGSARFSPTTAKINLEVATKTEDGEAQKTTLIAFKALAHSYGLKPEDLGRTFTTNGKVMRITGLNTRSHKYPVTVDCLTDGKKYKISAETTKSGLARESK